MTLLKKTMHPTVRAAILLSLTLVLLWERGAAAQEVDPSGPRSAPTTLNYTQESESALLGGGVTLLLVGSIGTVVSSIAMNTSWIATSAMSEDGRGSPLPGTVVGLVLSQAVIATGIALTVRGARTKRWAKWKENHGNAPAPTLRPVVVSDGADSMGVGLVVSF